MESVVCIIEKGIDNSQAFWENSTCKCGFIDALKFDGTHKAQSFRGCVKVYFG